MTGLPVGRVGRPHGLDGSFYVTRPKPRLLSVGAVVHFSDGRSAAIVRRAGTDAHPIVRLEGVDARSAAEALRGVDLSVERAEAPALEEGEWWAHELEGCAVVDGNANVDAPDGQMERAYGTVRRLVELPSCEALEVQPDAGGEPVLIPMVKDAVRSVDVAARRIDVNLDFLDLSSSGG